MQIGKLDHVNVRTSNLETMVKWYTSILGMRAGDRPNFPFPGAWMYAGPQAVVHLVGVEGDPGIGSESKLKLEHFALSASGRVAFEKQLAGAGEKFERNDLPDVGIVQYNLWDPDGNHIHIDFPAVE